MVVQPDGNAAGSSQSFFKPTATVSDPPLTDRMRAPVSKQPLYYQFSWSAVLRHRSWHAELQQLSGEELAGLLTDFLPHAVALIRRDSDSPASRCPAIYLCSSCCGARRLQRCLVKQPMIARLSLVQWRCREYSRGSRGAAPSGHHDGAAAGGGGACRRLSRRSLDGRDGSARGVDAGSGTRHVRNVQC